MMVEWLLIDYYYGSQDCYQKTSYSISLSIPLWKRKLGCITEKCIRFPHQQIAVGSSRSPPALIMLLPSLYIYNELKQTMQMRIRTCLTLSNWIQLTTSAANHRYLTTCRLEYGNGVFYPETEYDSESKVRIFNDLMTYGMRKNNYNSGTQLNLS